MTPMSATNVDEAKAEMVALSLKSPGMYFLPVTCFGLFYITCKRLPLEAPSDEIGPWKWYVLNGKVKGFTEAQVIADQQATPTMS